jgi:hypothetical protein
MQVLPSPIYISHEKCLEFFFIPCLDLIEIKNENENNPFGDYEILKSKKNFIFIRI